MLGTHGNDGRSLSDTEYESSTSNKCSVRFDSNEPHIYRYESLQYDFDQVHQNADIFQNGKHDDTNNNDNNLEYPKRSNASIFYSILDHIINMLSDGSRFKCVDTLLNRCCNSCKPLEKLLSTYIDLTTLQDIVNQRNKYGICGYIYCNNHLPEELLIEKKKSRSTYKIDLVTKNIYKRSVYYSFCCPQCIDDNKSIKSIIANSPMETGAITPRAMRSANNSSLERLYDNVLNIPKCIGVHGDIDMNTLEFHKKDSNDTTIVDDVIIKENMDNDGDDIESKQKISKCPFANAAAVVASATGNNEQNINKQSKPLKCPLSIYKSPKVIEKFLHDPKLKMSTSNNNYLEFESYNKELLYHSLSLFSILLCTFNNFITTRTKHMLIYGNIDESQMDDTVIPIYQSCIDVITDEVKVILDTHIKNLLSTFNIARITLCLNKNGYNVVAVFLLHVLLENRRHVSIICTDAEDMLLDEMKIKFKQRLKNEFHLDEESISILSRLFTDD